MRYIPLLFLSVGLSLLAACTQANPTLPVDPDTLAQAINAYEGDDLTDYAANCGIYFAYPDKLSKIAFLMNPQDPTFQADCRAYAQHLSRYLNKIPAFKSVTAQTLMQADTWQHYFKSSKAHGKGLINAE